jgi:hypothetical protein
MIEVEKDEDFMDEKNFLTKEDKDKILQMAAHSCDVTVEDVLRIL